jgi:hypothetical protein
MWDERIGGALHPSANVVEFLPLGRDAASNLLAPWELEAANPRIRPERLQIGQVLMVPIAPREEG